MPKAKTREELDKQIADTKNEIRQDENLVNELLQKNHKQERNDRTHRLIERGAIAESLIIGANTLTNEQFKTLLSVGLHTGAAREVAAYFKKIAGEETGETPDLLHLQTD